MHNIPPAKSPVILTGSTASKDFLIPEKQAISKTAALNFTGNAIVFLGLAFFIFSSCSSTKNTTYFQTLQKDTTLRNLAARNYEATIQKNDLLGINVASLSPDITFYNSPQSTVGQNATGTLNGYLVDKNGDISFLKIGILHVEGLTRKKLKDTLEKGLIPYLREAIVSVAFLNRHITLLGGINTQVIPLTNDNMTILDALALGGDISDKSRVDNILVIRERQEETSKEFKRLNLTDNSIFYSPYFYLQPNDIVYVEPKKIKANNTAQIISYITTGITFLIFILNQFLK